MSLEIARQIVKLIQQDNEADIRETLDPYSLEQRRRIVSIKHKRSSLLFIAVAKESVSIVKYFLGSCVADPNSLGWRNGVKLCCLAVAVDVRSETIVGILLTHGANTEIISSYGRTPLFHACCNDREGIARLLIEHGADVNSRNYGGDTPLLESADNLNLFKYLISKGSDINSVDDFGQTVLMLSCETEEMEFIHLLLSCEDIDVRLRNDYGEDALRLAVRYCSGDIVQEIIEKGTYTNEEMIEVYELESCIFRIGEDVMKAGELWGKALNLRSQLNGTPMYETQLVRKLLRVSDILHAGDVLALFFLESTQGLNNLFTLGAYVCAASNVNDENKYVTLCDFFFDTMQSFNDRLFFKCIRLCMALVRHFLYAVYCTDISNLSKIFGMIVNLVKEIHFRLQFMSPQRIMPASEAEYFLYFIIELVFKIDEKYPEDMNLFHEGINHILKADLRGLKLRSLTQICGSLQCPESTITCFIHCGANVNSTDKEGKTVLHEVVESEIPSQKIVDKIIDNGFDFNQVKYSEYCLPCRMERENLTLLSVKYISLQCLAARTLCEDTMDCFSDLPDYLRMIINAHFFLT